MSNGPGEFTREQRSNRGALIPAEHSLPGARTPYGEIGSYSNIEYGQPDGQMPELGPMLREYWRIFMKRKWLIATILIVFVGLGATRTLMKTPLYTSTVRLQIERQVTRVIESGNVTPAESWSLDFLTTQYELLRSRAVAERAASALKLGNDESLFASRQFSPVAFLKNLMRSTAVPKRSSGKRKDLERAAAGVIMANMAVRPLRRSRLVDVSYSDPKPSRSQQIANALADAFVAANIDKRFEANAYAKTFLKDQVAQLKLRLEESEKQLLEFAQKEQIVIVSEKESIAESNLAAANAALGGLVAERIKNEQQWRQLASANAISLPQLLTNEVIQGLRDQRNVLVTEYQEKLQTFKPSYPVMVQINNKIKEIDRQLSSEVQTIKGSLKAGYEGAKKQEDEMRKQIDTLRQEVLDLQKRSIQYKILKRDVDSNRKLYNELLQRQKEVDLAGGIGSNNIFVVDKAGLPSSPSSPNLRRALLLWFMLGLGVSLAAAYGLEVLDDRISSAEELERITGLRTLGIIPLASGERPVEVELNDSRGAMSEAYRSLCTALQFSTERGLPKTLLITSAGPGEGKSITALSIARHFAVMGLKVLLVDADLRNPSLHKKLGCINETGLSNYLTGSCTPPEVLQQTAVPNVAFMASGPLPPNAADLLGGPQLFSLLSVGLEVFDFIVVDGPPVMGLADALLLSNATAATIFVVASGQTRSGQIRGSVRRLELGRVPLIGAVLTKFDAKTAGYGYGYGYGNYGEDDAHNREEIRASGRQRELTSA